MNNTNLVLQELLNNPTINLNDYYCINMWVGELKLQGHYSSGLVKSFNKLDVDLTKSVNVQGFICMKFKVDEVAVEVTLT